MFIYICDHVLDDMIESLAKQIEKYYTQDGKLILPDFIAVGDSGEEIVRKLSNKLSKKEKDSLKIYNVETGEKGKSIQELWMEVENRLVLICDGIVDTGKTLEKTRKYILSRNPKDVKTLSVILRNDSKLIPNFYAMAIDRNDEIFFGRKFYPIKFYPKGNIRAIDQSDSGKKLKLDDSPYISGCLDDYIYYTYTDINSRCYVIEDDIKNNPAGIIFFKKTSQHEIFVDAIAVDANMRGNGFARSMLEFLDNYNKFNRIHKSRMLAVEDKVPLYEKFGYVKTGKVLQLSKVTLFEMETLV